jgi:acyl transferase domain-containing protein
VFIGATAASEFFSASFKAPYERVGPYTSTGTQGSIFANRISYYFNLKGPSMVVDTACSSSLTALHLAIQCLKSGECDTAIVGGSSLLTGPGGFVAFSEMGMLSPDGTCKPFDAAADGFGRCEGAAVIVIKRLADAKPSSVHSVIIGS